MHRGTNSLTKSSEPGLRLNNSLECLVVSSYCLLPVHREISTYNKGFSRLTANFGSISLKPRHLLRLLRHGNSSSPWNSAWLLYLRGIIVQLPARNSNEVARCDPHTENCGFIGLVRSNRPGWYDPPSWVMPSPRHKELTTMRTVFFHSRVGKFK